MDYLTAWQNGIPVLRPERDEAEAPVCAESPDRHLVGLALAGDEQAFEIIFERYKRLVASIAGRYFQQPAQVEEIIQIAFSKAYFELAGFRGDTDLSLTSWIGKIASNACFDVLRSQKRRPEDLVCELSESESEALRAFRETSGVDSETRLVHRDLADKLLSRIGAADRAVLQMLHAEGMSIAEIAEAMNWSRSKVKLRAWRARNQLRRILKNYL
ncbi:MAG: sigma-70 family RNA polymerase sigma factor [Acidobacteriota bacterium]